MDSRATVSVLVLLLAGLCYAHEHGSENEIPEDDSAMEDISATILRMNNGSSDFLLEGDVLIPRKRNAMKCWNKKFSCLWPKSANGNVEIAFQISEKYGDAHRNEILRAMKDMESKTCIRFVPRARERSYLSIESKYGCFSMLGRIGDKQMVSLNEFGCVKFGIIQHELLHMLGFYHEHSRSDRDQYIRINWENLHKGFEMNFKKQDTNNLDTPYDYSSIMHYGRTAFGKLASETITPLLDPSAKIGQRNGMSAIDIFRVNKLYKCWRYLG